MSDLFIGSVSGELLRKVAEFLRFSDKTKESSKTDLGLSFLTTRVDDFDHWGPAEKKDSGVYAQIGGRLAFTASEWKEAEDLPVTGGLASRRIVSEYLNEGCLKPEAWNGAGCVVLWDSRIRTLHVITDRLGVYPMFRFTGKEPLLCSHPDVLADCATAQGKTIAFDEVTAAEFLATGNSVYPHTYYQEIELLEPACHYTWTFRHDQWTFDKRVYWQPQFFDEEPEFLKESELPEALADAFSSAMKLRTQPRLGPHAVFLSGGADSRACLFGADTPAAVTGITLYDEENEELDTARRLAAAAGAQHIALRRSADKPPISSSHDALDHLTQKANS